ncbi:MAG: YcaQ family DNA glycosylase [Burkholderiaceae bacterium]|nr:YcaQ family DNA glycosylase [Burkholderiaceae bacterium]
MSELTLSLSDARALQLAAQGLLQTRPQKADKTDVLNAIRAMGALQIDTIHVVARSPYLVLWSRLGDYRQAWLEELLAEGALFEYWAHEACFLPIEDYGLYRHRMLDPAAMGWKYSVAWMNEHREAIEALRTHIRHNGPVRSADFERKDGKSGGWWGWKPEKRSLEVLFTAGELMIARRQNFQRVYDLAERVLPRVLPDWDDKQLPDLAATQRKLLLKAVYALGLAKASWINDYFRNGRGRGGPQPNPESLVEQGALLRARVDGWTTPVYIHPLHAELAQAAAGELQASVTTLLSPFDPLVWDRRRALELFDFDYRLECYTPAHKRRYGYFVLPILRRGALVGRLDAKAHRSDGIFEVKALHLEPGVRASAALADDVAQALMRCSAWHGTEKVVVTNCDPAPFRRMLYAALR